MTEKEQRAAAKQFAKDWAGRGDEKQDTQAFWMSLLQKVYGVEDPAAFIKFELRVKLDHTSFIDAFIEDTHVLIEQKGKEIDLTKGYKQSDGAMLTPYGQARRYAGYLPHNQNPRWIVVCNFQTFEIHDMNRPNDAPEVLQLSVLEKECHRLNFLVDTGKAHLQKELEVSMAAGEIVGKIYDAFYAQYIDPNEESLKSLNKLCVRLVFCLYAEDAGIFGKKGMFRDYLDQFDTRHSRKALVDLFRVLDTKPENRDKYLEPELAAFPYVNGGLFADEDIEIPHFTDEIRDLLLHNASEEFDWSEISPTIFGAVFESTLNPDTRRKGGMHYTSIENIHKVIDPLFLDDLKAELASIKARPSYDGWRTRYLKEFPKKLAKLKFFDPACGSGNFLTETYLSLRRLENEVIRESFTVEGQMSLDIVDDSIFDIQVSIGQFYGIEINDFAVTVAKTALWIAESQMMKETEKIVQMHLDFLPLKSYANIVEGNALRMEWESVVPKQQLSYIMGNPPFVGYSLQTKSQKEDIRCIYVDEKGKEYKDSGKIDYVAGWYFKAASLMYRTSIRTAFVSTNSITQGEQVTAIWKPLYNRFGIHIDFAYRSFIWDSEASQKAHVHCVIVGFSVGANSNERKIFTSGRVEIAQNINPYLIDAPNIFIADRKIPICSGVTIMNKGSQGTDDGHFYFSPEEYDALISKYPDAAIYIREATNGQIFISGSKRYCLWCADLHPSGLRHFPEIMQRIKSVQEFRLSSTKKSTRKWADKPYLFTEDRQPRSGNYLLLPLTSSERRKYVPIGYLPHTVIANNSVQMIPNASLYDFGILTSSIFMSWMRAVCGRLKSDYRITVTNVYNNFPWPSPTPAQKKKIEQTAQIILEARSLYPDSCLADMYGEDMFLFTELYEAHKENNEAVMQSYGFTGEITDENESEYVAKLMKMYQELTN